MGNDAGRKKADERRQRQHKQADDSRPLIDGLARRAPGAGLKASMSPSSVRTWLALIVFIALLGSIYLGQGSQAAVIGQRVHDKQDQLERTFSENDQLRLEIAALSEPGRVEERAKKLGFHQPAPAQLKYMPLKDYATEPAPAVPVFVGRSAPSPATSASSIDLSSWWKDMMTRLGTAETGAVEATSP